MLEVRNVFITNLSISIFVLCFSKKKNEEKILIKRIQNCNIQSELQSLHTFKLVGKKGKFVQDPNRWRSRKKTFQKTFFNVFSHNSCSFPYIKPQQHWKHLKFSKWFFTRLHASCVICCFCFEAFSLCGFSCDWKPMTLSLFLYLFFFVATFEQFPLY